MEKTKNFEEYLEVNEGMFSHADWVDMNLLQGTIERMRNEEYKIALEELNSRFPIDSKVNFGLREGE